MNTFLLFYRKIMSTSRPFNLIGRFLAVSVVCMSCIQSLGQQAKNAVQLGDQYYAAGEYYTAAFLYGQFLNPSKKQKPPTGFPLNSKKNSGGLTSKSYSRTDILFKQAESYRLANYWPEAASAYKECVEKNSTQHDAALYWLAVCKRSLGEYAAAEESLKQYLNDAGVTDLYKEAAEKELQTLQYIRQQLARPDSVLIKTKKLDAPDGKEKGVFAPVHIGGDQFLISSTQTDSVQAAGINPYRSRLFNATINNGNITTSSPVAIGAADPLDNQGAASVSADGKYLYISQWKKEKGKIISSIYYSVKQDDGWTVPVLLPAVNRNGYSSKQPFCSTDGNYLFFASDRPGGAGNFDIWYAPMKGDGTTGEPINAGTVINTGNDEQAPFYHNSSSTLVFSSNRLPGMGGYDLFAAKGSQLTWTSAENLGYPLSSPRDDIYFLAEEKKPLLSNVIFSSDRGSGCCLETYQLSKAPKAKRLSGILHDCSGNAPLDNAEIVLKDKAGNTWKATTGIDGKYLFDLGNATYRDLVLTISKDLYIEKVTAISVDRIDESDLMTDKLINTAICIEKKPVEEKLVIKAENVVTVYFDFDKSALKPGTLSRLDSIYSVLTEFPAATIQISGYTDGRGSDAYNKVLSDKRARACAEYLIGKGIEAGRITFVSFGACCPVEMELINGRDNVEGRSRNRRALINVKKD